MLSAASSAEPGRSWAWLIALAVAYVAFRLLAPWLRKIRNPSPTPALPQGRRVKVQATVGVTEPEPAEPEVGWWGRIVEVGGVRMRQAQQIARTGSHELPPAEEVQGDAGVPLGDEAEDEVEEEVETVEQYIARLRTLGVAYRQIVRLVMDHYEVSESTAKRRIRDVDEARAGQ